MKRTARSLLCVLFFASECALFPIAFAGEQRSAVDVYSVAGEQGSAVDVHAAKAESLPADPRAGDGIAGDGQQAQLRARLQVMKSGMFSQKGQLALSSIPSFLFGMWNQVQDGGNISKLEIEFRDGTLWILPKSNYFSHDDHGPAAMNESRTVIRYIEDVDKNEGMHYVEIKDPFTMTAMTDGAGNLITSYEMQKILSEKEQAIREGTGIIPKNEEEYRRLDASYDLLYAIYERYNNKTQNETKSEVRSEAAGIMLEPFPDVLENASRLLKVAMPAIDWVMQLVDTAVQLASMREDSGKARVLLGEDFTNDFYKLVSVLYNTSDSGRESTFRSIIPPYFTNRASPLVHRSEVDPDGYLKHGVNRLNIEDGVLTTSERMDSAVLDNPAMFYYPEYFNQQNRQDTPAKIIIGAPPR